MRDKEAQTDCHTMAGQAFICALPGDRTGSASTSNSPHVNSARPACSPIER
jgi:hypothetical protein